MRFTHELTLVAVASLLSACGSSGSGGGGGSAPRPVVASTEAFQLKQVWVNYLNEPHKDTPFKLPGTATAATPVKGTGVLNTLNFNDRFEGEPARFKETHYALRLSVPGAGSPIQTATSSFLAFNPNDSAPLGFRNSNGTLFALVNAPATIPAVAHVGDRGVLFTATNFQSATNRTRIGTTTFHYSLEPDTATTALLVITSEYSGTPSSTVGGTGTETYRVTPDGSLKRIGEVASSEGTTITITY